MYTNPPSDPYAGQYPAPPPPPTEQTYPVRVPAQTHYHLQDYKTAVHAPVSLVDPYTAMPETFQSSNDYYDPQSIPFHPSDHKPTHIHTPQHYTPQYQEEEEEAVSPEYPMVNRPSYPKESSSSYGPRPVPHNEADFYRPRPYRQDQRQQCNCCCYNPTMTCCSCFCMLIAIAFCAAGIALVIASKVITDKCSAQCIDLITQVASGSESCSTLCGKVAHDAMFYGGIVVAGLAGLSIVWRGMMWVCAGYSRK
ncbi:hypothetical protein BDF14DRAFT_533187 [Spinellus fusiger]|nr:hypothetical protein BDF14DRAFT_533187 [Spinellus fusiger]